MNSPGMQLLPPMLSFPADLEHRLLPSSIWNPGLSAVYLVIETFLVVISLKAYKGRSLAEYHGFIDLYKWKEVLSDLMDAC